MLGSAAIFGSKGMVRVPTITGLSTSAAASTAQASGLTTTSTGTVTTYNTGLNGIVATQTPTANSLLNYESAISYTYYVYETPPCSGTTTVYWGYCFGSVPDTGTVQWDHCNETINEALTRAVPNWQSIAGFTAQTSGPVSLSCDSGGGGGGGGGGGDPDPDPGCTTVGQNCNTVIDEYACTTEFWVYDSNCDCVFSYRANLC